MQLILAPNSCSQIKTNFWSGRRESNSRHCVGSAGHSRYTTPALVYQYGFEPQFLGNRPSFLPLEDWYKLEPRSGIEPL